jgi:predicted amidohydrolase YtcJ
MPSSSMPSASDVIFTARLIRTANPARPIAQAIAVREGKVLAVGTLEECKEWGIEKIDTRFADKVLTAGFVEAHAHSMSGMYNTIPYVGWFGRHMPDGNWVDGIRSTGDLIARIRTIADITPAGQSIIVAGFDPIYMNSDRLDRFHLDEATLQHPVFVFHASAHLATVNSCLLDKYDITAVSQAPGVGRQQDGSPNGELREPAAMALARDEFRFIGRTVTSPETFTHFGAAMRNAGITTVADLGNLFYVSEESRASLVNMTSEPHFPIRVVSTSRITGGIKEAQDTVPKILASRQHEHDKLFFPIVKLVLDGSIQGFTAVLQWPGYFTGEDHGLFLTAPEQVVDILRPFHEAKIGIHCHCNGDATSEVFINAIESLLSEHSWLDHRHTITHAQLITSAQMRRARNLGMVANFFVNHMFFWGDQHRHTTVGPDRAQHLNPCGTADRIGLNYSIHTDAPVTPPGHLHTMWTAVNRTTPTGAVLGESERISIDRAFHAATIDAAYQLHLDHLVGSLEVGKYADMTVLDDDPYEVDSQAICDISVWGTVLGGIPQPRPTPTS